MDENLQKKTVNKIITNKYKESCVGADSQRQIFNHQILYMGPA